jgi:hypothetical protein
MGLKTDILKEKSLFIEKKFSFSEKVTIKFYTDKHEINISEKHERSESCTD